MDWILQYWVQALFGFILTALGIIAKHLKCEYEKHQAELELQEKEQVIMKQALMAILMGQIHSMYLHHEQQGYIGFEARKILETLYMPYKGLNGNSVIDDYVDRMRQMPMEG